MVAAPMLAASVAATRGKAPGPNARRYEASQDERPAAAVSSDAATVGAISARQCFCSAGFMAASYGMPSRRVTITIRRPDLPVRRAIPTRPLGRATDRLAVLP